MLLRSVDCSPSWRTFGTICAKIPETTKHERIFDYYEPLILWGQVKIRGRIVGETLGQLVPAHDGRVIKAIDIMMCGDFYSPGTMNLISCVT